MHEACTRERWPVYPTDGAPDSIVLLPDGAADGPASSVGAEPLGRLSRWRVGVRLGPLDLCFSDSRALSCQGYALRGDTLALGSQPVIPSCRRGGPGLERSPLRRAREGASHDDPASAHQDFPGFRDGAHRPNASATATLKAGGWMAGNRYSSGSMRPKYSNALAGSMSPREIISCTSLRSCWCPRSTLASAWA